jgi:hypothetical protein
MGSCKNKRLIGPFIDGQLGECKWLEEHIAECSECLGEYETVQRLSYLARKADYSPPESSYWKKFGTRVIARIAARPQPRRYPRILESIFANKLALRLVTPLIVILIAVLAVRIYLPTDRMSPSQQMAAGDESDIIKSRFVVAEIVDLPQPMVVADVADQSEDTEYLNEVDLVAVTAADELEPNVVVEETDPNADAIEGIIRAYVSRSQLETSLTRLTNLDNGLRADISQEFKFRVFDTDNVLRFQIITGSNPSLAPLSSYREATGRFFAPEISNSRDLFKQELPNRWGYASGDDNYNAERQRHLELEFDLSREK